MAKEKNVARLEEAISIDIMDLIPGLNYFVVFEEDERCYSSGVEVFKGNGESVFAFLKEMYNYEEWQDEYVEENGTDPSNREFLSYVSEVNGDGWHFTQIFPL
jgi:hypothetical protein